MSERSRMSETSRVLAQTPLFKTLGPEAHTCLAGLMKTRRLASDEMLYRRGDRDDTLYVVSAGRIRVILENDLGESLPLAETRPGEMFGEVGFFDGGPRVATTIAAEETEVLALEREALREFLKRYPHAAIEILSVMERRLREASALLVGCSTKNPNVEHEEQASLGQLLADRVAAFGGSWIFIGVFFAVLAIWVLANATILMNRAFDPYPFILLNLVLSMLSAFQAPIIMMSQNRQNVKDRIKADLDYQVDLKAEMEIAHLHRKVDRLHELLQSHFARFNHEEADEIARDVPEAAPLADPTGWRRHHSAAHRPTFLGTP